MPPYQDKGNNGGHRDQQQPSPVSTNDGGVYKFHVDGAASGKRRERRMSSKVNMANFDPRRNSYDFLLSPSNDDDAGINLPSSILNSMK
jgi:hypothetical protein